MLLDDRILATGVMICCSFMIGIGGSFGRIGMFTGSPRGVGGVLLVSATTVFAEPVVTSDSGDGAIGNLKSENAGDGIWGEVMASIFGVEGTDGR